MKVILCLAFLSLVFAWTSTNNPVTKHIGKLEEAKASFQRFGEKYETPSLKNGTFSRTFSVLWLIVIVDIAETRRSYFSTLSEKKNTPVAPATGLRAAVQEKVSVRGLGPKPGMRN